MKRTTRFICIIAIFTLITGIFTSCTNSGNGTNPSESTTTSFVETSETTTTAVTTAEYPMYDDAGNLVFKQCTNEEFNLPKYARYLTTATAYLSAFGIETTPQELFEYFPKAPFDLETEEFPDPYNFYIGESIESENFGCILDVMATGINNFFTAKNLPYWANVKSFYHTDEIEASTSPSIIWFVDVSLSDYENSEIGLLTPAGQLCFSTNRNPAILLKMDSKNLFVYESVLGTQSISKESYNEFVYDNTCCRILSIEKTN